LLKHVNDFYNYAKSILIDQSSRFKRTPACDGQTNIWHNTYAALCAAYASRGKKTAIRIHQGLSV